MQINKQTDKHVANHKQYLFSQGLINYEQRIMNCDMLFLFQEVNLMDSDYLRYSMTKIVQFLFKNDQIFLKWCKLTFTGGAFKGQVLSNRRISFQFATFAVLKFTTVSLQPFVSHLLQFTVPFLEYITDFRIDQRDFCFLCSIQMSIFYGVVQEKTEFLLFT